MRREAECHKTGALEREEVYLYESPMEIGGSMTEVSERITVDPKQCGGRPCIRGMRIRVVDVLDLLASGLTAQQVLDELPDLEMADIEAALRFASQRLNHPILAA